ncbi:MAG: UDP-N-acetylglucosamine 2-epimerase [Candidatus Methylomirabilales bacterium]
MRKRRVLGITGVRSEYFLQRPIFQAIMSHPELDLELVVTGAHLSPLHGYTVTEIEADGFPIVERVESLLYSDRDAGRVKGAALQLQVLAHIVDSRRPDWLLASTDREEAMTMALCGAYMNVATAHYSAGDRVVGNVDDMIRHAVSRIAHLLLTSNEEAQQRLIRAGEEEWRVHNVGHAGLDRIRSAPTLEHETLTRTLGVSEIKQPYLMVVQHPISSAIDQAGYHMRETLAAIVDLGLQAFVSYPNSDPGSHEIIRVIEEYSSYPNLHVFRTIPDVHFINLLRGAAVLIGNSSLGILEAPFLRLPVVNVGMRQTMRHHAENVFFVPHDCQQIIKQIQLILEDDETRQRIRSCSNPFGDGRTGERVANLLASIPLDTKLLNKDLRY